MLERIARDARLARKRPKIPSRWERTAQSPSRSLRKRHPWSELGPVPFVGQVGALERAVPQELVAMTVADIENPVVELEQG